MSQPAEIISTEPNRAARAPTDVLRLGIAAAGVLLVLVIIGVLFDEAIVGFVADLIRGIETLPSWLVTGIVLVGQILGIIVVVGGAVAAILRGRWRLLAVTAVAAAAAVLLTLLVRPPVDSFKPDVVDIDGSYTLLAAGRGRVHSGALRCFTAVITAAAPWVV